MTEPTKPRVRLDWRHLIMAVLLIAGVLLFLHLYRQPTRQGFAAVLAVRELHISPAEISVLAANPGEGQHIVEGKQLSLTSSDSLAVSFYPSEGSADSVPTPVLEETLVSKNDAVLCMIPRTDTESARLSVVPDRDHAGGTLGVEACVARLGMRVRDISRPDLGPEEPRLLHIEIACERPHPRAYLAKHGCHAFLVYLIPRGDAEESPTPSFLPLDNQWVEISKETTLLCKTRLLESIRGWGWWSVNTDYGAPSDMGEINPRLSAQDTMKLSSYVEVETLSVDARVCSLRVFSSSRKEPVALAAPTRVNVIGKINMQGTVTNQGMRLELSGVATSITYEFLSTVQDSSGASRDSLVGEPIQVLPSKLEEFSGQTVALAAMLFAFLTLLSFIWDIFLKKQ